MNLSKLCVIIFLVIIVPSCKKSFITGGGGSTSDSTSTDTTFGKGVYVTGYQMSTITPTGNPVTAQCWKNGKALNLNVPADKYSSFNCLTVSGNDVYFIENVFDSFYQSSPVKAYYWKNGMPVDVSSYANHFRIESIAISGNDVYVGGNFLAPGSNYIDSPGCWKNGVRIPVEDTAGGVFSIDGLAVSGSDVYMTGNDGGLNAVYWKNGKNETACEVQDSLKGAYTYAITTSGNDVFTVGDAFTVWHDAPTDPLEYYAAYWKNGQLHLLSNLPSHAHSIQIIGNDVYVGGWINDLAGHIRSVCWKNGVEMPISNANIYRQIISYQTGLCLFASSNGLYYAESILQSTGDCYAGYWENGNQPSLIKPGMAQQSFIATGIGVVQ